MLDLQAPLRRDDEFLSYCKSDDSIDDHIPNPANVSRLNDFGYPMVSGFTFEFMHSFLAGAFSRRINGIALHRHEGQVSVLQRVKIETRLKELQKCKPYEFDRHVRSLVHCGQKYKFHELRQFLYYHLYPVFEGVLSDSHLNNVMRLQYSMLLLGSYNPDPVPTEDIDVAQRQLQTYVEELISYHFPICPTTHGIIHCHEDVRRYGCGLECLSAFKFESFMQVFSDLRNSGYNVAEQFRNR